MRLLPLAVPLLVGVGVLLFWIDNPPANFSRISGATVTAFSPASMTVEKRAGMEATVKVPSSVHVRLPNGKAYPTNLEPIREDDCTVGGPASAEVRIGKLWPRVISVEFAVCEKAK